MDLRRHVASLVVVLLAAAPVSWPARAQAQAPDTVEEEAVFDEEPAAAPRVDSPTAAATVEEEAVFGDEPGAVAAAAPAAGTAVEEEAVFAAGDGEVRGGLNAGYPVHDTSPWWLILPALGLALLAGQVRWRGPVEEKR